MDASQSGQQQPPSFHAGVSLPSAAGSAPSPSAAAKGGGLELTLPFTTIKKMSKTGTDIKAVTQDATVMITKATELLLEALTAKGAAVMASEQRRELKYGDVASAVKDWKSCEFLSDVVPPKVKVSSLVALAQAAAQSQPQPQQQ